MEKLSANTLRKLGLCEDHFLATSFMNSNKDRLIRNAIPIAYENAGSIANEQNIEVGEMQKNITAPNDVLSSNNENLFTEKQMSEERALRTYKPAALNFAKSTEEENVMEWVHLEPPINQNIECDSTKRNIECEDNSIQRNNKEISNLTAQIKVLRNENLNLRQKIKRLKSQMQRIAQRCKCKDLNKTQRKKEMLTNLINEQKLHPVAKAMIHLQLHTPRTPYTEEEKMLSKELYYYSTSAFCRLKKAGCNFPGQRTITRWAEECNIKP